MFINRMEQRTCDSQGCGYYGAPRGSRKHNGVDLACKPDTSIQLGFSGKIVKVGWAYSAPDKRHLRYVAIKIGTYYCRLFYINPSVKVGDSVDANDVIGFSLQLSDIYTGITDHVHIEFYKLRNVQRGEHNKKNFLYVDPNVVLDVLKG